MEDDEMRCSALTWKWKFTSFNEFGNTQVNPNGTRTNSIKIEQWNSDILSNIDGERKNPVNYEATHRRLLRPRTRRAAGGDHFPEKRARHFLYALYQLHYLFPGSRAVLRHTVRQRLEPEVWVAAETLVGVGVA